MSDDPMHPTHTPAPEPAPAPTAPAPGPTVHVTPAKPERGAGHAVGRFFHYLFLPISWILRPLVFRVSRDGGNPKVSFTSFSALIYLWPIMAVGWLGVLLEGLEFVKEGSATFGWIWITTVLVVLITVAADLDRNKLFALIALIVIVWMGGFILQSHQDIPVLSKIHDFFARQDVSFNRGMANVMSVIIAVILVGVTIIAWFDGRYEITTREITHKRTFRTSDSLPRAAKRIKRDWRDVAEAIIGLGAGDVIVLDTQKNIVMRIPNVPFLWFFREDVDHILEVLATTEAEDIAAAMEEGDI